MVLLLVLTVQDLPQGAVARFGDPSKDWGQSIQCLAVSPNGKRVVSVRRNGEVRAWDVDSAQPGRTYIEADKDYNAYVSRPRIEEIVFSPDGKQVIGAGF